MGIEPTGKEIEIVSMVIHHFEDGQVVADNALLDNPGLLRQLGVVELPIGESFYAVSLGGLTISRCAESIL